MLARPSMQQERLQMPNMLNLGNSVVDMIMQTDIYDFLYGIDFSATFQFSH